MKEPKVETKNNQVIITCPDEIAARNCAKGIQAGFKSSMVRGMLLRSAKKHGKG